METLALIQINGFICTANCVNSKECIVAHPLSVGVGARLTPRFTYDLPLDPQQGCFSYLLFCEDYKEALNGTRADSLGQKVTGGNRICEITHTQHEEDGTGQGNQLQFPTLDGGNKLRDKYEGLKELPGVGKEEKTKTVLPTPINIQPPFLEPELKFPLSYVGFKYEEREKRLDYIQKYKAQYRKTICIDFDGVIHNHLYKPDFSTWYDFYEPMPGTVLAMEELVRMGWYIVISTVRQVNNELLDWLIKYRIPFHDVNGMRMGKTRFWAHNPEFTGMKPVADIYLDDKDLFWQAENVGMKWNWDAVLTVIKKLFPEKKG